jgi:rhamnulose-1-phosphate aldolase
MAQRIATTDRLQRGVSSLAETASLLSSKGWAEANAGNISVEVTELLPPEPSGQVGDPVSTAIPHPELQGRSFLITGAGTRMRDVAREAAANCCVLRVADDLSGYHLLWGGETPGFRPTSELPAHLAIHAFLRRSGRP